MKNVALSLATPAGNVDEANAILGKVVEPKIRWNLGSLVGSAIAGITQAVIVFLDSTKLSIYTPASAAAALNFIAPFEAPGILKFSPVAGNSRSRLVDSFFYDGSDYVSVGIPADPSYLLDGLLATTVDDNSLSAAISGASRPSWTLAGLISKIDAFLSERETPVPFMLFVNQFTGDVFVAVGNDVIAGIDAGAVFVPALDAVLYASFDLSDPVAGGPDPIVPGPVWG